ncbi:MAG: hypothetical protein RQ826_08185 [Xanthomonadales bacterium]|nr:hypothetical protein [Xanthomonadales bacterium]
MQVIGHGRPVNGEKPHQTLKWALTAALILLLAGLMLPVTASAQHSPGYSSGNHDSHSRHSGSRYSFGYGGYGSRLGYYRGGYGLSFGSHGRHGLQRGSSRLHGRSHILPRLHGSRHDYRHGSYGNDCELVYKHADVNGRPATIEGLRCYDDYGDAYIVPESREIVEYHDYGYRR